MLSLHFVKKIPFLPEKNCDKPIQDPETKFKVEILNLMLDAIL
jgi:hypothetical protein